MPFPIALALVAASAAASAGTGLASANARNGAMRRAGRSARSAATTQYGQVSDAAALERQKRINENRRIEGLIRVRQAEAGVGSGGSFESLAVQNDLDAALDLDILKHKEFNEFENIRSGLDANLEHLSSQTSNPMLAAFIGAVQGANTGLSLYDGANRAKLFNFGK
jgi:hypothetical protein